MKDSTAITYSEALKERNDILKSAEDDLRAAVRNWINKLKEANRDVHAKTESDWNPDEATKAMILQLVLDRVTEIATLTKVSRY